MRILCTGGNGFIGSAVCNKLITDGNEVISFDNFSRKLHINDQSNIKTYIGDIRNINDLNDCVEKYGPFDALWHLAYINGTKTFYSNPGLVLDVGVKGATNTLDVCIKHNISNYILVSSSEVYNEPTIIPTPETERIIIQDVHNPRFSYSGGKIISELLAIHYGATNGLNVKIFRPHNVYGENMGFEHVLPELIKKIIIPENPEYIDNKLVINIQGTGKETRAFCYVENAADQMLLANKDITSEVAPIYNIGMENEVSIQEMVYCIAALLGKEIIIVPGEKAIGSCNRRCPSMKKIAALGYITKQTPLEGLTKTAKWYERYYEDSIK